MIFLNNFSQHVPSSAFLDAFGRFLARKEITARFLAGPRSLPFSHRRSRPRPLRLAATDKRTYREPKASIRRDITVTDRLVRIDVRPERPPRSPSTGLIRFPRSRGIREKPLATSSNATKHPRRGSPVARQDHVFPPRAKPD